MYLSLNVSSSNSFCLSVWLSVWLASFLYSSFILNLYFSSLTLVLLLFFFRKVYCFVQFLFVPKKQQSLFLLTKNNNISIPLSHLFQGCKNTSYYVVLWRMHFIKPRKRERKKERMCDGGEGNKFKLKITNFLFTKCSHTATDFFLSLPHYNFST